MLGKCVCSAPGKIILCGEHAVVYGKEAIACALDLRTTCCAVVMKEDRRLEVSAECLGILLSWPLDDLEELAEGISPDPLRVRSASIDDLAKINSFLEAHRHSGHERTTLMIVIYYYLFIAYCSFKESKSGLKLDIKTDLPIGCGLGSSASFCTAMVTCLLVLCQHIPGHQSDWSETDKKLICAWAYEAEKIVHGKPSGIDNSISTYGHALIFKSGEITRLDYFTGALLHVIVVNTKVPRSTKKMVADLLLRRSQFPDVYDCLFDSIQAIVCSFKACLLKLQQHGNSDDEETKTAIMSDIGHLVEVNQGVLNAIGVGHAKLDEVIETCRRHELHAKLTGAGGGGCAFAVVPPGLSSDKLLNVFQVLRSFGFDCWEGNLGGSGAVVHEAEAV